MGRISEVDVHSEAAGQLNNRSHRGRPEICAAMRAQGFQQADASIARIRYMLYNRTGDRQIQSIAGLLQSPITLYGGRLPIPLTRGIVVHQRDFDAASSPLLKLARQRSGDGC